MIPLLLITNPSNISYLTGFVGTLGYVLITKNKLYLFTDSRYLEAAKKLTQKKNRTQNPRFQKYTLEVIDCSKGFVKELLEIVKKHRYRSCAFEGQHVSVTQLRLWRKNLRKEIKWIQLQETIDEIEKFRVIKTQAEIRLLKKAQDITDRILNQLKRELKVGMTEQDVAWRIEQLIRAFGAQENSFPAIVAFEEHSAIPHHHPTDKKLKKGHIVLIDMGIKYKGYCSDMTRTLFTKTPTKEQEKVYFTVLSAQEKGIRKIKSGVRCSFIDQIARKYIEKQGFGDKFGHSYGHGVGLDIHESPTLSSLSGETLKTGMVVTAEPGIYLPGKFGVRIEDMLIVTENGSKNLTKSPKRLEESILWKF